MYNGVGLATVRGTATNGYVQKNLAHRPAKTKVDYNREMEKAMQKPSLGALSWPRACALAPPGTPRACARSPRGASVACRGWCSRRCRGEGGERQHLSARKQNKWP